MVLVVMGGRGSGGIKWGGGGDSGSQKYFARVDLLPGYSNNSFLYCRL